METQLRARGDALQAANSKALERQFMDDVSVCIPILFVPRKERPGGGGGGQWARASQGLKNAGCVIIAPAAVNPMRLHCLNTPIHLGKGPKAPRVSP